MESRFVVGKGGQWWEWGMGMTIKEYGGKPLW